MQLAALGPRAISLGLLDAANFNLVMGVFVGARDRIFDPMAAVGPYTNITQNKIGEFNLVLLHTFFRAPSIQHGNMAYIYTKRPDTLTDPISIAHNRQLMDGFDERRASRLFSEMAMRFEGMYWNLKPPDTKMPEGWSLTGTLGD